MAIGPLLDFSGRLLTTVRRVDRLFESQDKVKDAIILIEQRLRAIEDRLLTLEAKEDQLITEARSAASAAATTMSSAALNDLVTRLTRAEMRLETLTQPLSPRPMIPGPDERA
jgi:chromosome segregation ATPase